LNNRGRVFCDSGTVGIHRSAHSTNAGGTSLRTIITQDTIVVEERRGACTGGLKGGVTGPGRDESCRRSASHRGDQSEHVLTIRRQCRSDPTAAMSRIAQHGSCSPIKQPMEVSPKQRIIRFHICWRMAGHSSALSRRERTSYRCARGGGHGLPSAREYADERQGDHDLHENHRHKKQWATGQVLLWAGNARR
jgi:hypothetical protein